MSSQICKISHEDKVNIKITGNEMFYFNSELMSNWLGHEIIAQDITPFF